MLMVIHGWRVLLIVSLVVGLFTASRSLSAAAEGEAPAGVPPLTLLKTIPIGGTGRWDYLCADSTARRLYVPRSTHVQILDLDTGAVLGDVADTNGVHGVALAPEQGLGFSSNGRANTVSVFDLKTFKVSKIIKTGRNPDAIIYDPASKHILAINHSGGSVTVIDPAALDRDPVTIAVVGTLEFAVADGAGHVFVNVEDKDETVEIDSKANRVLAHWPLAPGHAPTGLSINIERQRLFVGCGNRKMIVLDSQTGKVLATVEIGRGVDGTAYEPTLGVAMSANGRDGTISVVKETSAGNFVTVATPKTLNGARTITVDTKMHQALLPCNVPDGKDGQTFGIAVVGVKEAGK
jgi:YVTN family beta-propeller protein